MNYQVAAASYKQVKTHSAIEDASPHKLILMLFDGALERIAQAKGAMQYNNIPLKGEKINNAINIVNGLRENLNHNDASELSKNLDATYEYVAMTLARAHAHNDAMLLDEASGLLTNIADAWKQIA